MVIGCVRAVSYTHLDVYKRQSTGGNTEVSFIVKLIEQGLFFIGIFFLVRFIAPYLLRLSQKMNIGSSVIIMSLIICLGMAYLADLVGLSSVVGAFFAGIAAVSYTHLKGYKNKIKHRVSIHTRLVLTVTATFLVLGTVIFYISEYRLSLIHI